MGNNFTMAAASAVSPVSGRYANQSDVENLFGVENVKRWSQLDPDLTTVDATRVDAALDYAEGQIHTKLRGGIYAIPLVLTDESVELIKDIQARLAGVWLYESRGIDDYDVETGRPIHRLGWHARHARSMLQQIRAGVIRLQATRNDTHPDIPIQP